MQRLNNDINIFVVTHKVFQMPPQIDASLYTPIQVGTGDNLGYLQETQLDNIAHKNTTFCELTALYFIWKNVRGNYAGLIHYSRYLCGSNTPDTIVGKKELQQLLSAHDMVLPNPSRLTGTTKEHYATHHHLRDWDATRTVLLERYPEYVAAFDTFAAQRSMYSGNIVITRKALLDNYCAWLFDILFTLEPRLDLSNYSSYDRRVFGFLSERLLNVWLIHHQAQLRVACLPICRKKSNTMVINRRKGTPTVLKAE